MPLTPDTEPLATSEVSLLGPSSQISTRGFIKTQGLKGGWYPATRIYPLGVRHTKAWATVRIPGNYRPPGCLDLHLKRLTSWRTSLQQLSQLHRTGGDVPDTAPVHPHTKLHMSEDKARVHQPARHAECSFCARQRSSSSIFRCLGVTIPTHQA